MHNTIGHNMYLEVGEGGGHADDLDAVSGGVEDLSEEEL